MEKAPGSFHSAPTFYIVTLSVRSVRSDTRWLSRRLWNMFRRAKMLAEEHAVDLVSTSHLLETCQGSRPRACPKTLMDNIQCVVEASRTRSTKNPFFLMYDETSPFIDYVVGTIDTFPCRLKITAPSRSSALPMLR